MTAPGTDWTARLADPHRRKSDKIPINQLRRGDVVRLDDGRIAVLLEAVGGARVDMKVEESVDRFSEKVESLRVGQIAQFLYRIRVGDYVIARGRDLGVVIDGGSWGYRVRHFDGGKLQRVGAAYPPGDLMLADPDRAAAWLAQVRASAPPVPGSWGGPSRPPKLADPRLRPPDELTIAEIRRGDRVQLDDGREAVVWKLESAHSVRALVESSPGKFDSRIGEGAYHQSTPPVLPLSRFAKVLYRLKIGDYVVNTKGQFGVLAWTDPYLVRHFEGGRWLARGRGYYVYEIALAEPDEVVGWLRSIEADPESAPSPPSGWLQAADLWPLVSSGFEPTSLRPEDVRPGDIVSIQGESLPRIVVNQKLETYSAPSADDVRHRKRIRPSDVTAIRHRLREGDFVLAGADGTRPKLGRIDLLGATLRGGENFYMVRTLTDGRRWAEHTAERSTEDIWPLDPARVAALLAAEGIPQPPLPASAAHPATGGAMHAHLGLVPGISPPLPGTASELGAVTEVEPVGPPMPPGQYADAFAKVAFGGVLRRYQSMAVDAFEKARASGRRRAYLVLPPGAGKTLVGLEIARRLGNQTLALGPNTAIQEQWVKQWREYQPGLVEASDSPDLKAPITALTYQSICNLDAHNPALDEQIAAWQIATEGAHPASTTANPHHDADVARLRGHARTLIAQGNDHEKLLAILHPNGRRLLERIKAAGQVTILLDECHHLLEMWGYLVRALVQELGENVFLVGLTATPPAELDAREANLYRELFGRADFEVPTPAVVKEGNLAPYQELAYLTTPLDHENTYIAEEKTRFAELVTEMVRPDLGTVSFSEWLRMRIFERSTKEGVEVAWSRFESDNPQLALAALRYCNTNQIPIPDGARLGEAQRQALTAEDWVTLIGDYCVGHLRESGDAKDLEAWEMIRRALPSVGFVLTRQGIRSYVSPVDRVLLLSASKGVAAIEILNSEERALGSNLRALMLCDYEVAESEMVGKLRGVLDAQAGSAALLLRTLLSDQGATGLDPILVTGRTVACSRATAAALIPWLADQSVGLRDRLTTAALFKPDSGGGDGWESVVEIRPASGAWSTSDYLPLVTSYFEAGRSRCLIGTRGLLGEGWDAKSINVLIDLTGVTTTTSVHQMRGRSLRLDPRLPHKVANNWDVVCVARDHPKGMADYERFVRKHRNYFAITTAGEIESGVGHVDQRLSPFGPPPADVVDTINFEVLERSGGRDHVYDLWGIGQPYHNLPTETVRIRAGRPLGLPAQRLLAGHDGASTPPLLRARAAGGLLLGVGAVALGFASGQELLGLGAGLAVGGGGVASAVMTLRAYAGRLGPSSALEDLASAVAEGLARTALIDGKLGAGSVRIVSQPDGYYRCYLEGASLQDSTVFATALDGLLAPIQSPRYIIPRYVAAPPGSWLGGLSLLARQFGNPRLGAAVVYHAVPSVLAVNHERVAAFQAAWNERVSAGLALSQDDPRAQALMQLQRGEDPFAVTTQMRTLWE